MAGEIWTWEDEMGSEWELRVVGVLCRIIHMRGGGERRQMEVERVHKSWNHWRLVSFHPMFMSVFKLAWDPERMILDWHVFQKKILFCCNLYCVHMHVTWFKHGANVNIHSIIFGLELILKYQSKCVCVCEDWPQARGLVITTSTSASYTTTIYRLCRERGDRGVKRHRKSFLSSSGKIAQRLEAKRSENGACSKPGDRRGRPPGRPVCTRCTGTARSTARSTVVKERLTGTVDRLAQQMSWLVPVDPWQGLVDRPVDRQTRSVSPERIRTPFLFWGRIQLGFPNPCYSLAIKKG